MTIAIRTPSLRSVSQPCIFPYLFTHPHYAKDEEDVSNVYARITAYNGWSHSATLHILPQSWFPNSWSWSESKQPPPQMSANGSCIGTCHLCCLPSPPPIDPRNPSDFDMLILWKLIFNNRLCGNQNQARYARIHSMTTSFHLTVLKSAIYSRPASTCDEGRTMILPTKKSRVLVHPSLVTQLQHRKGLKLTPIAPPVNDPTLVSARPCGSQTPTKLKLGHQELSVEGANLQKFRSCLFLFVALCMPRMNTVSNTRLFPTFNFSIGNHSHPEYHRASRQQNT